MNKSLHSVGALLLHLVGDVTVDVQREGRSGVAQVGLHGLDVVADLQGGHRVGMTQKENYSPQNCILLINSITSLKLLRKLIILMKNYNENCLSRLCVL